jgi:hypothetical protein
MERAGGEVGVRSIGQPGGRNPPVAEPAALRSGEEAHKVSELDTGERDSCIAGRRMPTTEMDHRGVLSDVEFPELFDAVHEIEQFVRRNPWPMLALGFAAGYWLSRSKAR